MAVSGDKLVNHILTDDTSLKLFNYVNSQIVSGVTKLNPLELLKRENYNLVLLGEVYKNMSVNMCKKLTSLLSEFYADNPSNAYMYRCFIENKIYPAGKTLFGFARKSYSEDEIFSSDALIFDFITSYKCLYKLLYLDNYEQNLSYRVNNIRNGVILNNYVGFEEIGLPERDASFFKEKGFYDLGDLMPAVLRYLNNDWESYIDVFKRVVPKLKALGVLHPICYTKSKVGNILKLDYPFNLVAYVTDDTVFAINLYNYLNQKGYLSIYSDLVTRDLHKYRRCEDDVQWLLGYFRDGLKAKELYLKPAKRWWYDFIGYDDSKLRMSIDLDKYATLDWRLRYYFRPLPDWCRLYKDVSYIEECILKAQNE